MASVDPAGISPNLNFSFGKENTTSSAAEMEKGQIKDIVSFKKKLFAREKHQRRGKRRARNDNVFKYYVINHICPLSFLSFWLCPSKQSSRILLNRVYCLIEMLKV